MKNTALFSLGARPRFCRKYFDSCCGLRRPCENNGSSVIGQAATCRTSCGVTPDPSTFGLPTSL